MWIKLEKHIGEGAIWYSLPSDDEELKFNEGDLINCKLSEGAVEKLPVVFSSEPGSKMINGIYYVTYLRAPYLDSKNALFCLDQIEVNQEEMLAYKK